MTNPHTGRPVATRGKPVEESRGVVVMIHGRGRDTDDILEVAERIGDPDFAYLAPSAKDNSWYPYSFLEPIEKNEPHLSGALDVYDELVNGLVEMGILRWVLAGRMPDSGVRHQTRRPLRRHPALHRGPDRAAWDELGAWGLF
jgi:hypothetical protein